MDQERENYIKWCLVVVDIFTEIMKNQLEILHDPNKPISLQKKNHFNKSEQNKILQIPTSGSYESCDVSLLYRIIRNLPGSEEPTKGWNEPVRQNDVKKMADDIQRMHHFRNEYFAHMPKARMPDVDYQELMTQAKDLAGRCDIRHQSDNKRPVNSRYLQDLQDIWDNPITPIIETRIKELIIKEEPIVLRGMDYFIFQYQFDPEKDKIIEEKVLDNNSEEVTVEDCISSKENMVKRKVNSIANGQYELCIIVERQNGDRTYFANYSQKVEIEDFADHVSMNSSIGMIIHNRSNDIPNLLTEKVRVPDPIKVLLREFKIEEWNDMCESNYKSYSDGIDMSEYIDSQSSLIKMLHKYYKSSSLYSLYSLFIRYNVMNHAIDLGFNTSKINEKLGIDLTDLSRYSTLLYDAKNRTIFFFQELDVKKGVKENWQALWSDMMLFASLHKDIPQKEKTDMNVIGVLFTEEYSKEDIKDYPCNDCNQFCLTKEVLESYESFSEWWSEYMYPKIQESFKKEKENLNKSETLHRKICSRIIGSLSKEFKNLPNPFDTTYNRLMKLPLTPRQQEVVETKVDHLIITGPYGSGKSVVIRKKLFEFLGQCSLGISIFYLNGDPNSALIEEMLECVNEYKVANKLYRLRILTYNDISKEAEIGDVEDYINSYVMTVSEFVKVRNIDTDEILYNKMFNISGEKVDTHLFIDEFDGELVTKTHAAKVNELIRNDNMQGRKVIIASQAIKKERKIVDETMTSIIPQGYQYKSTGMKVEELSKNMRNTTNILQVLRCAVEALKEFKTVFDCPQVDENSENLKKVEEQETIKEENIGEKMVKNLNLKRGGGEEAMPSASNNESATKEYDNEFKERNLKVDDDDLKSIHSRCPPIAGRKLLSTFEVLESTRDHNIDGKKVVLIKPFPHGIPNEFTNVDICHLKEAITVLCCLENGQIIICFDCFEKNLLQTVLDKTEKKYITYCPALLDEDEGRTEFYKFLKKPSCLAISDYRGVRGLELEKAIVVVSNKERFLAPYYPEALSRAMCHLTILYLEWIDVEQPSYATMFIDKLNGKDFITQHVVEECEAEECVIDRKITTLKESDGEECTLLCHHQHCSKYNEVYESRKIMINEEKSSKGNSYIYNRLLYKEGIDQVDNSKQKIVDDISEQNIKTAKDPYTERQEEITPVRTKTQDVDKEK